MSKHICDCGQVYSSTDAVLACQNAQHSAAATFGSGNIRQRQHSAAAANELADALAFAAEMGVNPYVVAEKERKR